MVRKAKLFPLCPALVPFVWTTAAVAQFTPDPIYIGNCSGVHFKPVTVVQMRAGDTFSAWPQSDGIKPVVTPGDSVALLHVRVRTTSSQTATVEFLVARSPDAPPLGVIERQIGIIQEFRCVF